MTDFGKRMSFHGNWASGWTVVSANTADLVVSEGELLRHWADPLRLNAAMRAMARMRRKKITTVEMAQARVHTICLHLCEPLGSYTALFPVPPWPEMTKFTNCSVK